MVTDWHRPWETWEIQLSFAVWENLSLALSFSSFLPLYLPRSSLSLLYLPQSSLSPSISLQFSSFYIQWCATSFNSMEHYCSRMTDPKNKRQTSSIISSSVNHSDARSILPSSHRGAFSYVNHISLQYVVWRFIFSQMQLMRISLAVILLCSSLSDVS